MMFILPIPSTKLLMPVPDIQWREPSQAQFKDQLGNPGVQTRFRIRAMAEGKCIWQGWFDSRYEADDFLWCALTGLLKYNPSIWRTPSPEWHQDIIGDIWEDITYEFATTTFLTTTGSNQTYTSPGDWNNANNTVELLGGGASGGSGINHSSGGGGGSYSKISNFSFATPGTTTATYRVAALVAGVGTGVAGNAGNPSWWNNATDPGTGSDNTKAGAKGGTGGVQGSGTRNGGAGGVTSTSWGETLFAGGRGGNQTGAVGISATGGGGAASPSAAGGNGVDSSSSSSGIATAGGTSNNGSLAGGTTNGAVGNPGNAGTNWDGSHGSGSGGAGGSINSSGAAGGDGGLYGGAGGGAAGQFSVGSSGGGKQGIVVVIYTAALGRNWGYVIA